MAAWAEKIVELYENDEPEKLANLCLHITDNPKHQAPLNALTRVDAAFKAYLDKVQCEIDGTLAQWLDENQLVPQDHATGFTLKSPGNPKSMLAANGCLALSKLPACFQKKVIDAVVKTLSHSNSMTVRSLSGQLATVAPSTLAKCARYGGNALIVVALSWECVRSISQWWKGEISGKRCTKQLVEGFASFGAGVVGGEVGFMAAAAYGLGPVGIGVSAVAGGVVASCVGANLSATLTDFAFGLPKEAALENAYNYLGIHHNADNSDVNKKYRELCLKYHPDKGGNIKDFQKLQVSMQLIRCARGQA